MSSIAAPYWLLAGGILVLILGYLIAALSGGSNSTFIDHRMSDEEIARQLEQQNQGNPIAGLMILAGYLAIFVSIAWRLYNKFT